MKTMKTISAFMLIALMATMLLFETDVSLAKRKTPPSKVYGLRLVKATKSSITIKWRRARRARKYIVYRSRGSKGRFVKRAVTSRTRFTDYRVRPGAVYRYYVRGYNGRVGRRSRIMKVRTRSSRYVVKSWKIGVSSNIIFYDPDKQASPRVKAVLYSDGLLEIVGEGDIAAFIFNSPWNMEKNPKTGKQYSKQIRRVYISKFVKPTSMSFMFAGCEKLSSINRIPDSVKSLGLTFRGCRRLTEIPEIPSGVESMEATFSGCIGMETAPKLPEGVENMYSTFSDCSYLRKAPKLPKNVRNLTETFKNCTFIKEAPEIPATVKLLDRTFEGCTSLEKAADIKQGTIVESAKGMYKNCTRLSGNMYILGTLKRNVAVSGFFENAATAEGALLKLRCKLSPAEPLTAKAITIDRLIATKSDSSKIKEVPYGETAVIKSWKIGGEYEDHYDHDKQGDDNVIATLHKDGLLKIYGEGDTQTLCERINQDMTPWEKTKIGGKPCTELIKYAYIGRDVTPLYITAWFRNCGGLRQINRLPEGAQDLNVIFLGCKELRLSPPIPDTADYMERSFAGAGLTLAPELPEGIKTLWGAFMYCQQLRIAPKIPKSAEHVQYMFSDCYNLIEPSDIPKGNSIKDASAMYANCYNLNGKMYVDGAIKESAKVEYFFTQAAKNPGKELTVMYYFYADASIKKTVNRVIATKSANSNIKSGTYVIKPK